ncbi:GNAT family N-acetyltransferase [Psychroflexus aestuariivivens]|uniref:GNAT family N-acetyltransferase n=1 Tax=Psychroflexus aestuariivivens TaxID=1795040 RepID=UPI001F01DDD8|nr:GNAT family N-acetyltransferase [Psychroflexus aestuariivivens]
MLHFNHISAEDCIPLRNKILRPGKNAEECIFEGDYLKSTMHFGAFFDSEIIGILSIFKKNCIEIESSKQFQLRGMAVSSEFRKQNIGKKLLVFAESKIKETQPSWIWCNARSSAVSFYKKSGYEIISEEFLIPEVGPHFRMSKLV